MIAKKCSKLVMMKTSAEKSCSLLQRKVIPALILALTLVSSSSGSTNEPSHPFHETWYTAGQLFEKLAWPLKSAFIELIHDLTDQSDLLISTSCRSSLKNLATGLSEGKTEAYRIFDSFSKIKAGAFRRKHIDFGNYDQCIMTGNSRYVLLSVRWPTPDHKHLRDVLSDQTNSSFWMTSLRDDILPMQYVAYSIAAFCLPEECSQSDAQAMIESDFIRRKVQPFTLSMISSEAVNDNLFPDHQVLRSFSRTILILVIVTVVTATISSFESQSSLSWMRHFNARRNAAKLFQETTDKRMDIFHGFKVVYLLSCIISHYGLPLGRTMYPFLMDVQQFLSSSLFFDSYTKVGFSSVSFNFVVAACLAVISWMTEMKRRGTSVRFSLYVMVRMLRTLPLLIACHLFGLSVPLFPSGMFPYMQFTQRDMHERCLNNGWRDYLFIANAVNANYNCNTTTWFVSADMQLYVISFFTITMLYTRPRHGVMLVPCQIVIGIVLQFASIYLNDASPVLANFSTTDSTGLLNMFTTIYTQWYNNLSSYSVGLLLGYLIVTDYQMDQKTLFLVRCASPILFLLTNLIVILSYDGASNRFLLGRSIEMIFGSFYKAIVSTAFAGCMFVAFHDDQSWLRRLHSCDWILKWMIPLSRISFSIYLIHLYIIAFIWGMTTEAFHFQYTEMTLRLLLLYPSSIAIGLAVYLCFEAPFYNLMKVALKPDAKSSGGTIK